MGPRMTPGPPSAVREPIRKPHLQSLIQTWCYLQDQSEDAILDPSFAYEHTTNQKTLLLVLHLHLGEARGVFPRDSLNLAPGQVSF